MPYRIGRALCFEAGHVSAAGGPSQGRAAKVVRAAEQIAHQLDNPHLQGGVLLAQGTVAYLNGRWKRAGEQLDRAGVIFRTRCTGMTFEVDWSILFSLWSLQYRGELAELGRRWPVVLKEALERGDRHMVTILNTFLMSTLRLAADDPEGAEAHVAASPGPVDPARISQPAQRVRSARRSRSGCTVVMARAPGTSSGRGTSRRWLDRTSCGSSGSGFSSTRGGPAARSPQPLRPPIPARFSLPPSATPGGSSARGWRGRERCRSRSERGSPPPAATGHEPRPCSPRR